MRKLTNYEMNGDRINMISVANLKVLLKRKLVLKLWEWRWDEKMILIASDWWAQSCVLGFQSHQHIPYTWLIVFNF